MHNSEQHDNVERVSGAQSTSDLTVIATFSFAFVHDDFDLGVARRLLPRHSDGRNHEDHQLD